MDNSILCQNFDSFGRTCAKCGVFKDWEEFYTQKGGKFGKRSICKVCDREQNRSYLAQSNNSRKTEGTKVCRKCGIEKDVSEFVTLRTSKDGLGSWCKQCSSEHSKAKNYPRKTEGLKVCTKCGIEKDVQAFPSHKRNPDGLYDKCRECCKAYSKEVEERSVLKIEGTKKCAICGEEKPVAEFWKRNTSLDGLYYNCITCGREYNNGQTLKHKDRIRAYKEVYYQENKDGVIAEYKEMHKDEMREKAYAHHKEKLKNEPQYKLSLNLRRRLTSALKKSQKSGSAVQDLGCSIPCLKFFLENQFYTHPKTKEMMSWENYGRGKNKWQIDHIKELHTFDLSDRKQFLQACHVTNLQPIWWDENLKKSMKIRKKEHN